VRSDTVFDTALKTYISIHNVIISKYLLKPALSVNESIMNMAPRVGLGALQPTLSQARSVIFKTLNQLGNTQPTIYPNTSSFVYSPVLAGAAFCITLPSHSNSATDTIRSPVLPHINRVIKYRKMTCAGFGTHTGYSRGTQRTIVGITERPRRRWDYDIKMYLQQTTIPVVARSEGGYTLVT
jgi:hypothetical protein